MNTTANMIDRLATDTVLADALQLAFQHTIFDRLLTPHSATQLAVTLSWQTEPTFHLLMLLWSFDLLTRECDGDCLRYQTASEAQALLCREGRCYRGDAWQYRLQTLRGFGQQLAAMLQQPSPEFSDSLSQDAAWAAAADSQIAQEQRALTADTACALAADLPQFTRRSRLLDMGGGPGLVSAALAAHYPQLDGVVMDLPLTAAVAQRQLNAAGVGDRFSALSELDANDKFDIIWCSSFLYFVADPACTLDELYLRLKPGGVLISAHAQLSDDPQQVRQVLPFFLPLMMRGKHVFHHDSLARMLTAAGFRVEDGGEKPFPMSPLQVYLAFRE